VKFKDADLIGIPLRVVVGGRSLKDGQLELKWRDRADAQAIALEGAPEAISKMVAERKSEQSV
jgi:prolyl-tRNA synthetase